MGDYDPNLEGEEVDLGEDDEAPSHANTAVLQVYKLLGQWSF